MQGSQISLFVCLVQEEEEGRGAGKPQGFDQVWEHTAQTSKMGALVPVLLLHKYLWLTALYNGSYRLENFYWFLWGGHKKKKKKKAAETDTKVI